MKAWKSLKACFCVWCMHVCISVCVCVCEDHSHDHWQQLGDRPVRRKARRTNWEALAFAYSLLMKCPVAWDIPLFCDPANRGTCHFTYFWITVQLLLGKSSAAWEIGAPLFDTDKDPATDFFFCNHSKATSFWRIWPKGWHTSTRWQLAPTKHEWQKALSLTSIDAEDGETGCQRCLLLQPYVSISLIPSLLTSIGLARFLKKNDKCGSWVEVDDKTAREKVSQHLRDAARPFRGEETEPLPLDWELWIPQGVVDPFPDEESLASYLELIQGRRHTMWTWTMWTRSCVSIRKPYLVNCFTCSTMKGHPIIIIFLFSMKGRSFVRSRRERRKP